MAKQVHPLQDRFLDALRKERLPVSIYLVNGIKLQGHIASFDRYAIVLRSTTDQLVYKQAISTVVPTGNLHGTWADQADDDNS